MRKILIRLFIVFFLIAISIASWNYFQIFKPVTTALSKDPRNKKTVNAIAYRKNLINPSVIVFDLRKVSEKASQMDVTRSLLLAANSLKDSNFDEVYIAYQGKSKFKLEGRYFKRIGDSYSWESPINTIRKLPENVKTLDDAAAFPTWTGGWIGVMNKQLEDHKKFHQQWYLNEWSLQ